MKFVSLEKLIEAIERIRIHQFNLHLKEDESAHKALDMVLDTIKTLETIDPYGDTVQYSSVDDGIKAHAETYSFNIESKLFNQLSEEQQKLWREEIEQAVISGGEAGVELARDTRYKENLEVKNNNLELIDKSIIVAEIEKRIEAHKESLKNCDSSIAEMVLKGSMGAYQSFLHFLNTLKAKKINEKLFT